MTNPNLSAELTPAEITEIKHALEIIKEKLPFLVNLTPKQRKELFKMGPKSLYFVEYAVQVVSNHPEIMSATFSVAEFTKDFNLARSLSDITVVSNPLFEGMSDTQMLAGVEAMKAANLVYAQVKLAAKGDSSFDSIRLEMKRRYERTKDDVETPPPPSP